MKIPLTGSSYAHPSQATNFQKTVNMYLSDPGPLGVGTGGNNQQVSQGTLLLTPGSKLLVDLGTGVIRGLYTVGNAVYAVCRNRVYKLVINNITRSLVSSTLLGTIGTTAGTVYFASNTTQIILTDETADGYIITIATGAMAIIASNDFRGAKQVTYLDGYFIYCYPGSALMYTSAINDGTTWDAADVATAEMKPDNLIGLGVTRGELWAFGEETIEVWFDAGNASGFPLSVRVGSEIDSGCAATGSIVAVDNVLMWLDNRGYIVQSGISPYLRESSSGYNLKIVSTDALNNEIASYDTISDAVAITYNLSGHIMYQITFPVANKTWVYDQTTQQWHERTYYNTATDQQEYHLAQYLAKFRNINIVGGQRDGKIYIMDKDYFDEAGVDIHRLRQTSYQQNEFKRLGLDYLELRVNTGYAAQGTDPKISLRYSHDNGHTWSNSIIRNLGKTGEYGKRICWNRLGTHHNWLFEIATKDAVDFAIIEASIYVTGTEEI